MFSQKLLKELSAETIDEENLKIADDYFSQYKRPELDHLLYQDWQDTLQQEPISSKVKDRVWEKIAHTTGADAVVIPTPIAKYSNWWKMGIGILALAIMVIWLRSSNGKTASLLSQKISVSNTDRAPKLVNLNDGSKVWLRHGAAFTYSQPFANHIRAAELLGEAYIEVAEDPQNRPFQIKAGGLIGQIRAGHINVDAMEADEEVRVGIFKGQFSGIPAVEQNQADALWSADLEGNIIFFDRIHQSMKGQHMNDSLAVMAWRSGQLGFSNEPIGKVIREVADYFQTSITLEEKVDQSMLINKTFDKDATIEEVLKQIVRRKRIRWKKTGNGYVIYKR